MNDITLYVLEKKALSVKNNFLGKIYDRAIKANVLRLKNTGKVEDFNAGPRMLGTIEKDLESKMRIRSGQVELAKQQSQAMGISRKDVDEMSLISVGKRQTGLISDPINMKKNDGKIVKPKGQGFVGSGLGYFDVDNGSSIISNKEVRNRLIDMHEMGERKARKGYRSALSKNVDTAIIGGHLTPDILFKDHNMLTTLEGLKPRDKTHIIDSFRNTRKNTQELFILDMLIPGGFGKGPRVNRRYRKYLTDKIVDGANVPMKELLKNHNFVPNS